MTVVRRGCLFISLLKFRINLFGRTHPLSRLLPCQRNALATLGAEDGIDVSNVVAAMLADPACGRLLANEFLVATNHGKEKAYDHRRSADRQNGQEDRCNIPGHLRPSRSSSSVN